MQVNVSQLLREPVGSTRDYEINEIAGISGDDGGCPVTGKVRLMRTPRSILADCELSTEVELHCSRCLSPFCYRVMLIFKEEYVPTIDAVSGTPLPSPEEAGAFTIDEHHILDLTEAVRQYTMMATPMKPLCREDCAGLCQDCGDNLNEGNCDCPETDMDPRWSKLTELL
ncbi:MAG: hypothetical protein A2144_03310 [Chloroflexi bacterium RBG_16_50_9]|nr:MAG: hypothetical protein A2144_03310 [Chloroflexi bacterium RBG_16_50_9]